MRIPTLNGTGSLLVSLSSLNSRDQFWYKRRNILNHHESLFRGK